MTGTVISWTRPSDVRGYVSGNKKVRYFDVTSDTGDYPTGGVTKTAAALGFKHIDFVGVQSPIATQGTDGASGVGVGIKLESSGTVVRVQLYEVDTAADGAPFQEKGAEAMVANFVVRVRVEGH